MTGLTSGEINRIVNNYIGVNMGYLGDFSYRTHSEFYPMYCELDIDPNEWEGTTRLRFIEILKSQSPSDQVKILRGVLERFPLKAPNAPNSRTLTEQKKIEALIQRLEKNALVTNLSPRITSEIVDNALTDAENLINTSGVANAVDRIHTALHGYLRAVCSQVNIDYDKQDTMPRLLKCLRQQHPAFRTDLPRNKDLEKILNAFGTILDSLNKLRNDFSLAHPNPLLDDSAARLAINSARTILHYLDAKLSEYPDDTLHIAQ